MKKIISIILSGLLLVACETTSSDNGVLDGMWYLTRVDTLSNGQTADYRSQRIFWSFQGSLAQFNCSDGSGQFYMSHFSSTGSNLILKDIFLYDRVNGDSMIDSNSLHEVQAFGINSLNESFAIEKLNNAAMVLKDDTLRLTFEKY